MAAPRPRRVPIASLLLVAVVSTFNVTVRSNPPPSPASIIELTRSRLSEITRNPRRLEPLPLVVANVHATPAATATLTLTTTRLTEPATECWVGLAADDAFRLLHGGYVLGVGGIDETMIAIKGSARTREGADALLWRDGVGTPVRMPVATVAAHRADRWYAFTTSGLLYELESGEPRLVTDLFRGTATPIATSDGVHLLMTASPRDRRQRDLRTAIVTGGVARTASIRTSLISNPPALLRRPDGGWLIVGDRILTHDLLTEEMPREEDLAAAIDAARAGDTERLGALLTGLSRFNRNTRQGLEDELQRLPDASSASRQLLQWFEGTIDSAQTRLATIPRPAPTRATENAARQLRSILADAQSGAAALRETLHREHPLAPGAVAQQLKRGRIHRDGRWMDPSATVLHADGKGVLLRVRNKRLHDPDGNSLAYVDATGRLTTVPVPTARLERRRRGSTHTSPLSVTPGPTGDLLIFSPATGLGRFDGERLEWVDSGSDLCLMSELVGCDQNGRMFFRQRDPLTGARRWFMYAADGAAPDLREATSYGTTAHDQHASAVVDDRGRLWFVSEDPDRLTWWRTRPATPGSPAPLTMEIVRDGSFPDGTRVDDSTTDIGPPLPALYRVDAGGVVHRVFAATDLDRCGFMRGVNGSVLLIDQTHAYLVTDERVIATRDLATLARNHGDELLAAAPEQPAVATGVDRGRTTVPAIVRTGGIVWVTQGSMLEAFRDGVPLRVGERVAMRTGPMTGARLYGVLSDGEARHLLLAISRATTTSLEPIWVTVATEGAIEIVPIAATARVLFADGSEYPVRQAMTNVPVLDIAGGRLLFTTGERLLETTGPGRYVISALRGHAPRVLPDGGFLVQLPTGGWPAVARDGATHAVDLAWLRDLEPTAIADDGILWCTAWNGLAALRAEADGQWRVDRTIEVDAPGRVTRLLGQSDSVWYLACDPTGVVRVPKEAPGR